tara:strand:+ start:1151 stop:1825 length:675 start_codon:yes stop_codon:yes gene_type:complete
MSSKFSLIIDFDSTIVKIETIDCLAGIVLSKSKNKNELINQINKITNSAMNGEISFKQSIDQRLSLLDFNTNHISRLILEIIKNIDSTFVKNLDFFEKYINDIYIISGGFKNIIIPVLKSISDKHWKVFANDMVFHNEKIIGIDEKNILSENFGKVNVVKSLNLYNDVIVIGDGFTDYEIKKYNLADYFLCYTRHVKRKKIIKYADLECYDFNDVYNFINEKYL